MTRDEYLQALARFLEAASGQTPARLAEFQEAANDADIDGILIDVFVDQDGEGPFDVWVRFDGHDAFALDRRFDESRHLFAVTWDTDGWSPAVPARPRGWSREELEDALVDAVTSWVTPLLPADRPKHLWTIGAPAW